VATLWQLCGNFVATLWQLCGNFVATLWQLCGNSVVKSLIFSNQNHKQSHFNNILDLC
jgi:hypothetical protein